MTSKRKRNPFKVGDYIDTTTFWSTRYIIYLIKENKTYYNSRFWIIHTNSLDLPATYIMGNNIYKCHKDMILDKQFKRISKEEFQLLSI